MAEIDCRPQASFPRCSSESLHALSVLFFKAFIIGLCPLPSLKWRALGKSPARRMFPLSWGCIQNREPLSARGLEGGPSLPPFLIH